MTSGSGYGGWQQRCRVRALVLLVAVVACCSAAPGSYFPHVRAAEAVLPSRALFLSSAGRTLKYTIHAGNPVAAESLYTGNTSYPHVYSDAMNGAVVALLNAYLTQTNVTLPKVGGGFPTCIDNNASSLGGQACFKALLAAASPADCPAANVLCCPLFWRVENQSSSTTLDNVIRTTIFWDGQGNVNGFYTNFSSTYLQNHSNCSTPLYSAGTAITLAVDAYGEWRFVNLTTRYTLLETVMNVSAAAVAKIFGGDPQTMITNATVAAKPLYSQITVYTGVGVSSGLLLLLLLLLVIVGVCGVRRAVTRIRAYQLRAMDLVSQQQHPSATDEESSTVLSTELKSESDSGVKGAPRNSRGRGNASAAEASKLAPLPPPPATARTDAGNAETTNKSDPVSHADPQQRSVANARRAPADGGTAPTPAADAVATSTDVSRPLLGRQNPWRQLPASVPLNGPSSAVWNGPVSSLAMTSHPLITPSQQQQYQQQQLRQRAPEFEMQQSNWIFF